MQGQLPRWLSTEKAVSAYFSYLGFAVQSVSIDGRQIDLVAKRLDSFGFAEETWVVEVTTEKVDADKGSKDSQKLLLAQRTTYPDARLMLITTDVFTPDQVATLRHLGIVPLMYAELEARKIDLSMVAIRILAQLDSNKRLDVGYNKETYVIPRVTLRKPDGGMGSMDSEEWAKQWIGSPKRGLCALLGNLGSGKTSLLQHILETGCNAFVANSNTACLPFYLPLGKYKQHSGNIDQMLMAQFREYGIDNYPSSLIRFLMASGRIVLPLDGLDEAHPIQNSNEILETVVTLLDSLGGESTAILSCRRQFLEASADELAYFGSFTSTHLQAVQRGLSKILSGHPETSIAYIDPFDDDRIHSYLTRRCGLSVDETDALLGKYYGFKDLCATPVLLSMIATTITEGLISPNAHLSYPIIELYEAYTNRWLERDIGRAKLNVVQRKGLSESLSEYMLWEAKERADWSTIRRVLHQDPSWKDNPLTDSEAELDIRNSGFLIRDFDDKFRFVHRSILEYFAATHELSGIMEGKKLRHFPTDGYRMFLLNLMSRAWLKQGYDVFPDSSWASSNGDTVLAAISATLSAATQIEPVNGEKYLVGNRKNILVLENELWKNAIFTNCHIQVRDGTCGFENCVFKDTSIEVRSGVALEGCLGVRSAMHFETGNSVSNQTMQLELNAKQLRFSIPIEIWILGRVIDDGFSVTVSGQGWKITYKMLDLLVNTIGRIRGKVKKSNWQSGLTGEGNRELLEKLVKIGFVEEDTSREGHQLQISHEGLRRLGEVRTRPLEVHDFFFDLLNL
jgi:hypothetical protein